MSVSLLNELSSEEHLIPYEQMIKMTSTEARLQIRQGLYEGHTAGIASGMVQGNVVILPREYAKDFLKFCLSNPKPCPLIAVSETGVSALPELGNNIDIRTDISRYNVYENGELKCQRTDIQDLWSDGFVSFVIGCSFSFEEALLAANLSLRHVDQNRTVPMYRTKMQTVSSGPFRGEVVVSMRPYMPSDAVKAMEITSAFPKAHGSPLSLGATSRMGIKNILYPEWGDAVEIFDGEIPVFWACGVTTQVAIQNASPSICITHAPGSMLITDVPIHEI